jgi:hypothetical protein
MINGTPDGMPPHGGANMSSFYASLLLIWIPGFLTNLIALFFIIRDIKKAIFPAIVLLLVLCASDFTATCFSFMHNILKNNIKDMSNSMCVSLSVLHAFFKLYSGVLNVLMASDRVMAICTPFYYKKHITVTSWIIACSVAAIATALLNLFPLFGLGNYWAVRITGERYCSSISYKQKPMERVYGLSFGFAGIIIALTIVTLNVILIRTILKLVSRVIHFVPSETTTTVTSESDSKSAKANQTSFEIAFAKLMLGLAAVYLICDTPYNVSVQTNQICPPIQL